MLYTKLADRATVGFKNPDDIRQRALEYIYEAENRFTRHAGNYQSFYNDLMVSSANSHIVDLPTEFVGVAGRVEFEGVPLTELPDFRKVALNQNDLSWNTGNPYWYFIVNRQMFLYPEPSDTTKRLGALLNVVPREDRSALAEVSTIYVTGTIEGGEYFYVSSPTIDWCVYLTYDGVGADPEVTGKTAVQVVVNSSQTDAQIATAIQAILNALSGITVTASNSLVTITQDVTGNVKNVTNIDTPFLFHTTVAGQSAITSPIINLAYHDLLPIYAKAQICLDIGLDGKYSMLMAEWESKKGRAKYEIDKEGGLNPNDTVDEMGTAGMGRLNTRPTNRNYSYTVTETVNIRRASEAFTSVTEVTVAHNWGTYPIVQLLDDSDPPEQFTATIIYLDANSFKVDFGATPRTGTIIYS